MEVALAHVEYNHDIRVQFHIDNLEEFFAQRGYPVAQPYVTATFGPGWRIECWPSQSDGQDCTISCRLDVGPRGYPRPISCSFIGESMPGGHRYFEHTATYMFHPPDKYSSRTQHWNYRFRHLRQENGLVITATIRARAGHAFSDGCEGFGVLHDLITGGQPDKIKFIVFAGRNATGVGRLVRPRTLLFDKHALQVKCLALNNVGHSYWLDDASDAPALCQWEVFSGHKGVPSAFVSGASSYQPAAHPDLDGDSDFEDVGEEGVAGIIPGQLQTRPTAIISDVAASTWEAFLFYLYTGVVVFAPLASNGEDARKHFIANYQVGNPQRPAPCSCRSMYRLAHRLDMADLKNMAFEELKSQLSKDNVIKEIFSQFTSQHEQVKDMELQLLKRYWDELKGSDQVSEMMMKVVSGKHPHAASIMMEIWQSVTVIPT
ncbi:uncharacterized protein B0H18DRAFT_1022275 [Fomitopsis serialis]|uniref:uncharacterized protein n=1 Tax=Fomitopsis serialis TaxID=139415 RepID=UPI0020079329|nr:uncharacterized protein B0H18DRAFT_1022275 [Neoantrodia serialis]KAH9921168.1 hypothetical protein B0H18DRAFT_1022275 [Neoantrodia serialis]